MTATPQFEDEHAAMAHLAAKKSLTPAEFASLIDYRIFWLEETLFEVKSEVDSETAMFGDSGPGSRSHLSGLYAELTTLRRQRDQVKRVIAAQAR